MNNYFSQVLPTRLVNFHIFIFCSAISYHFIVTLLFYKTMTSRKIKDMLNWLSKIWPNAY